MWRKQIVEHSPPCLWYSEERLTGRNDRGAGVGVSSFHDARPHPKETFRDARHAAADGLSRGSAASMGRSHSASAPDMRPSIVAHRSAASTAGGSEPSMPPTEQPEASLSDRSPSAAEARDGVPSASTKRATVQKSKLLLGLFWVGVAGVEGMAREGRRRCEDVRRPLGVVPRGDDDPSVVASGAKEIKCVPHAR